MRRNSDKIFYTAYVKDTIALDEITRLQDNSSRCKKSNYRALVRAFAVLTQYQLVTVRMLQERGQLLFLGTNTKAFKAAKKEVMA